MAFVLDTSVTMAWCFEDEANTATDAVLDRLASESAIVPGIWNLEVANLLLVARRRRRIGEAQTSRFLDLLLQLPIMVDDSPADITALVSAGREHELTAYDAAYLLLAERLGVPLATRDGRLAKAAGTAGLALLIRP